MSWMSRTLQSSIGAKAVMAVTGVMLVGFVVAHLAGNLLIFAGRDALNDYAEWLRSLGGLLWLARLGLIGAVVLHIVSAIRIVRQNNAARPVAYRVVKPAVSNYATRTMQYSGFIVLAFIVFHLLHFTLGVVDPDAYQLEQMVGESARHDVYNMVIAGFSVPAVAISYVVAMILLSMHLSHGITSMFQTLGFNHPKYQGLIEKAGPAIGIILALGYISIPAAVLFGALVKEGV